MLADGLQTPVGAALPEALCEAEAQQESAGVDNIGLLSRSVTRDIPVSRSFAICLIALSSSSWMNIAQKHHQNSTIAAQRQWQSL